MRGSFIETLESRQLLSSTSPLLTSLAQSPAIAAMTIPAKAPTVYGSYVGTATITNVGVKGTVVVQISRSGTKIVGRTYSSGFGGFDVNLTGTVSGRTATLAGRSTTAVIKRITATMSADGRLITGTISLTQNRLPIAATFSLVRTAKPPVPTAARAPSLLGNYRGWSVQGSHKEALSLSLTRQSGGLLWGSDGSNAVYGVVLTNGRVFMHVSEGRDGVTVVDGQVQAGGKIAGRWEHNQNRGTFSFTRVS